MQREPEGLHLLNETVKMLSGESDFRASMTAALRLILAYFKASQVFLYIFYDEKQIVRDRFEASAAGTPPADAPDCPPELISSADVDCLTVSGGDGDAVRRFLDARGVKTLLAAPLRADARVAGLLCVGDASASTRDTALVSTLGYILLGEQRRHAAMEEQKLLTARYHANDERYRIALGTTGLSIWDYDHRTRRILPSPEGSEPIVENAPESLVECGHVHPDSVPAYLDMYERLRQGEKYVEGVFRICSPERSEYQYEHIRYTNIFDSDGKPCIAVGMSEDVSEKYAAQQNYVRELQLQKMLTSDMYATMLLDVTRWRVLRFQCRDTQLQKTLDGADADSVILAMAENVADSATAVSLFQDLTPAMLMKLHDEQTDTLTSEYLYTLPGGDARWMREIARLLTEPASGHLMLYVQLKDVDEEKRRLEELSRAAETDSMTGFLDHSATLRHMRSFLAGPGRHGRHALFMVDIDNFKSVNDLLGHIQGDETITRIARSIQGLFRGTDILGRIGGDEFLILMKNVASYALVVRKAAELVDALQFVCSSDTLSVDISASVGVCLYTEAEEDLDTLYAGADAALYRAKNAGKNRYAIGAGDHQQDDTQESAELSGIVQLRTLLEHMDGGVVLVEAGERVAVSYVSPSFYKSLHRGRAEVGDHGEKALDLVLDEDRPALIAALRNTAQSNSVLDTAYRVRHENGDVGWRHLRAALLPGDAGGVPKLIAVISDITEMKRASAQLEAIIENAPCGIGMLEYDGEKLKPLFFNNTMLDITGFSSKEQLMQSLGGDTLSVVRADDRPQLMTALRHALAEDCPFDGTYRRVSSTDAGEQIMRVRGVRLREYEQNGRPVLLVMYTDVTRDVEMERRLRLAEERYRIAITCAGIMLWEVDIPARTMRQSTEVAGHFAHADTEIRNLPDGLLEQGNIPPDAAAETRRMFENMFAGRDDETYFTRSRFDGEYMWLKIRFKVLKNERGEPYYAVGISDPVPNVDAEMRRFEQEQQLSSMLESSLLAACHINLSRGRVEYLFTKDQQLTGAGLKSYSELYDIGVKLAANVDEADDYLALLSVPFLFNMFRNNRTFLFSGFLRRSRDGTNRWTDCAVQLLRHPVSGDLCAFFYLRDADVRRNWELALPQAIEYDPATKLYTRATLEALVRSILADKRSEPGICAMTVFELVGLEQMRAIRSATVINELLFTVGRLCRVMLGGDAIAGPLDESHIAVFRASAGSIDAQQNRIRQARERIVQALRRMHPDDPIELVFGFSTERLCEAEYDTLFKNAQFARRSALRRSDSSIARYAEPHHTVLPAAAEIIQHNTVLIVDDSPSYLELLRALFETDYTVLTAADGADALRQMRTHPELSAVILDLLMPVMTGFQVLEAMRADGALSRLPVIVVTSDEDPRSEARALDLGASDVICKPFYGQTMLRRVRNIIARSDAARIAEQNRVYELRFQQQANLLRLADFDELSGIYNKRAFFAHVRALLDTQPDTRYVIVRWDIDRFKVFNDAFGTFAGDTLLREIGACLREYAIGSVYGRLDADHFAFCLPEEQANADDIAEKITQFLTAYPVAFDFVPRFGVYAIDEPEIDVSLMCDRALLALRSTKGSYSNNIGHYDSSLRKRLLDEQELISGMEAALEREEFELYFQPQYNYASGELIGAEALVRWQHPTRGTLMPGDFVPLFESNGFISLLDRYVWERSCRAMRRWLDDAGQLVPVSISVNISRLDIYSPQLCSTLKALVDKYKLPPSFLKLEITESAYMENPEQLIEVVNTLQKMGFSVEMDDFGSGYSSLNTLKDVPVDVLKLDIKFLTRGRDDSRGGNILGSIIRMARWLQLPVIAEGVETRDQADYLKSLGCFYMQGYFFSRPLPAAQFEKLLQNSRLGLTNMYAGASVQGAAAFWDPSVQTALVFNNLVGGAAIVEYRNGELEALRINDSFFEVLGTTRDAYVDLQTHMLDRLTPETRPLFVAMLERAIAANEEAACEALSKPLAPDGKAFWTRTRARLLAHSGDSYLFYISIENITERKQLEQRLQLRSYSDMLLAVYDEVFELDYAQNTATVRAAASVTGLSVGAVLPLHAALDKWCAAYVAAKDVPLLLELVSVESRHTGTIEYRFIRPDGQRRWISATMLCIGDNLYLLCNLDITDRRDMNLLE